MDKNPTAPEKQSDVQGRMESLTMKLKGGSEATIHFERLVMARY